MLCLHCKKERLEKDFLPDQDKCYKCVYEEKIKKLKKTKKQSYCRVCGEPCYTARWVYCSDDCAEIGVAEQKRAHWTMKVKSV